LTAERTGLEWLVWVAIGILLIAFVLRFLPHSTHGPRSDDHDCNAE
jgi:hypothetical protein